MDADFSRPEQAQSIPVGSFSVSPGAPGSTDGLVQHRQPGRRSPAASTCITARRSEANSTFETDGLGKEERLGQRGNRRFSPRRLTGGYYYVMAVRDAATISLRNCYSMQVTRLSQLQRPHWKPWPTRVAGGGQSGAAMRTEDFSGTKLATCKYIMAQ